MRVGANGWIGVGRVHIACPFVAQCRPRMTGLRELPILGIRSSSAKSGALHLRERVTGRLEMDSTLHD